MRRRYVYYKVAERDVAAVVEALRPLRERQPFELWRRPGAAAGLVTLMEVHGDADDDTEAAAALAPWRVGERHVEIFDAFD